MPLNLRRISFTALAVTVGTPLGGCTSIKQTYLPTGAPGYVLTCRSYRNCIVKAGRLCRQNGYTIESRDFLDGLLVIRCAHKSAT